MSVERPAVSGESPDPEATVELPSLDLSCTPSERGAPELGVTDTWVVPPSSKFFERQAEPLCASDALMEPKQLEMLRAARAAAEQRAEAAASELTAAGQALSAARVCIAELEQRLEARAAESRLTAARALEQASLLTEREAALLRLERRLAETERTSSAQLEALASLEGRRGVFESIFHGLDGELAHSQGRVSALEAELAALRARHAARPAEPEPGGNAARARVVELERLLAETRSHLLERANALENTEADLRAAEEMVNQLESDVRTQNTRIEELTRINDDWRSTLEEAREALEQREALIRKLESQADHGTALLERIEVGTHDGVPAAAQTGEPAAESATRLLIRADGDREVVHVLGRRTSIGRTPDNDVQLDTKFVSRHHAMILASPAQTILEDLSSTNGVLVNGRRVRRQRLRDGDAVVIGKTKFLFAVRP
ncbi:MAG TPA: FHA domain-containing protein [Steroidobacteraceae bacterium]|nr:FHA domain-containing protein [Steroidobacteraceae bacterium]